MKPILQVMCLVVVATALLSMIYSLYTTVPTIYDLAFMIVGVMFAIAIVIIVVSGGQE